MSDAETLIVFKSVLYYTALILTAPISTFFGTKILFFQGIFGIDTVVSNIWSAIFAVIVLHLALGLYIYKAYFEGEKGKPVDKID